MSFDIWTVLLIVYFSLNTWIACYFYGGREKTNKYLGILIDYFLGVFLILYFFLREMVKSLLDYTEFKFFYAYYVTGKYMHVSEWVHREKYLEAWLRDTKNPFKQKAYKLLLKEIKNYKNDR